MAPAELPDDIWRSITAILSPYELSSLLSVNRSLFNIVLDERYKEVRWEKLDTSMTWSLERLKTPSIAVRVRRLHIRAWFIDYLVRKERLVKPQAYVVKPRSWLGPVEELLGVPPPSPSKTFSTIGDASAGDVLESMTAAVHLMKCVTEYSFEWRDLAPTLETMGFVSAARAAFGQNLRKLCLNAQIMNFSSLISGFDNLDELDLTFDYDQESWETPSVLRKTIAPFINRFAESLRGLKIASSSKGDMAPLFEALGKFDPLRRLSVSLAFSHPKEPEAVMAVLRTNAGTLREAEIIRLPGSTAPSQSAWNDLSAALATDSRTLISLQRLSLSPLSKFDDTLSCLRRSSDTLTHITLIDSFLDLAELEQILRIFARRPLDTGLQKLHIGLKTLPLRVFELLVKYAPDLHTLYLVLQEAYLEEFLRWVHNHTGTNLDALDTLMVGLEAVTQQWQLRDVGVWDRRFIGATPGGSPTRREEKVSELLMLRIPSVRMVRGSSKWRLD
ncbi:hypothetical protein C8F01DRAFT_1133538 [Mycena amicta]|nr:hypothetical protein C8F01DRAFT_1133538 [Mycena amicta]